LANWVTLTRACVAAGLLGYAVDGLLVPLQTDGRWLWTIAASFAVVLDGIDGFLARRLGQASAFGTRFDMETDALTVLALCFAVWIAGQAGAWVMLSGLLRYLFIIGGKVWPVLAMPLPRRKRRQTICVVQLIVLIVALAPIALPSVAAMICLAGLLLLSYSFAVDTIGLLISRSVAESEAVR
jgi:phosphatidylglycerophosphate synthase